MGEIIADWAGKDRCFRLNVGLVMDLEEARGKTAVGEIYLRVASGRYFVADVWHILRLGLIGGGETTVSAKALVENHFDMRPYHENAVIAGDLLIALMTGFEADDKDVGEKSANPIKFSEISQISRTFAISPNEIREMRYADFLNMIKGFNATSTRKAESPSEEEFEAILAKHEPEALERAQKRAERTP